MKKTTAVLMLAFLMLTLVTSPIYAQYKKPRPAPKDAASHIKVDTEKRNPAGVIIGEAFIKSGEKLPVLWGIMGPPDKIWAMRSKDDVNRDYVKLDYYSYGISFDVNSNSNKIQGILIEENNRIFKMKEVPFRIGQDSKEVINSWGDPENTAPGMMAYWRRGVYIGVDDSGIILHFFITEPGQFEDETKKDDSKKEEK